MKVLSLLFFLSWVLPIHGQSQCTVTHYDEFSGMAQWYTPVRDKIAISCMLIQIREFSSHAITHELYIKNRKRLFCL